jgi:hypothetical protein
MELVYGARVLSAEGETTEQSGTLSGAGLVMAIWVTLVDEVKRTMCGKQLSCSRGRRVK